MKVLKSLVQCVYLLVSDLQGPKCVRFYHLAVGTRRSAAAAVTIAPRPTSSDGRSSVEE